MIMSSKSETLLYTEKKQMQWKPEVGRRENNLAKKDKKVQPAAALRRVHASSQAMHV